MIVAVLFAGLLALASGFQQGYYSGHGSGHHQPAHLKAPTFSAKAPSYDGPPTPYNFEYNVAGGDGSHSHEQSGDASGSVSGTYTIKHPDGTSRRVRYTADAGGYRATVTTNEVGTESKNPADVQFYSGALTGVEAALRYGSKPAAAPAGAKGGWHY